MSKIIKKNGLLLTHSSEFVEVEHQNCDFSIRFISVDSSRPIQISCSVIYFRVIASLVRYAMNHLDCETPTGARAQKVLFDGFDQFLNLVAKHPNLVQMFKNSLR